MEKRHIGIDFGTTNTIISYRDINGRPKKITEPNESSVKTAVFFKSKDEYVIGEKALNRGVECPQALVTGFKPNIRGEKYRITAQDGSTFTKKPTAIARMFLNRVLKDFIEPRFARRFQNPELTSEDEVIVTVPVKFNPEEKKAIKKAAEKAGFPNLRTVFEPTAAAIAIADGVNGKALANDEIIAVYDFGGGTFDISVIQKRENGTHQALKSGQNGDKKLGGDTVTLEVIKKLLLDPLAEIGVNLFFDEDSGEDIAFDADDFGCESESEYLRNLWLAKKMAEEIKVVFSEDDCLEDDFTQTFGLYGEPVQLDIHLTRNQYHDSIRPLIQRTVSLTADTIQKTEKENNVQVTKIILAGGSSKILLVQQLLKEYFSPLGIEIISSDKPFDLISMGAMILGENRNTMDIQEKTNAQYGIAEKQGFRLKFVPLIPENKSLPITGTKNYSITGDMLQSHEISVRFYEKDIATYPEAQIINKDEGLSLINEYRIPIPENCTPENVDISFIIEEDGTIRLTANFTDSSFKTLFKINEIMDAESDLD